jgi:hypothetical protein
MDLVRLQAEILAEMVPDSVFDAADARTLFDHCEFLLGIEDQLITHFYDTLFAHPTSAAVFADGERPEREDTLRHWWRRTIDGPLDASYWSWMALVGVVHIRRGVRNPMMLGMMTVVEDTVHHEAMKAGFEPDELERLRTAFNHLGNTVSALIAESYTQSYIGALQNLGGLNPRLLSNMLSIEIQAIEDAGRTSLG